MAFSTYSEAIDSIRTYLAQPDAPVADWFSFAEAELSGIRHFRMEKTLRVRKAANSARIALPEDYLELRSITLKGEHLVLASAKRTAPLDERSYTISGGSINVHPTANTGEELVITYYARTPGLSDSNPTNWLIKYYPNVYRHALLIEAYQFYRDLEGENASRGRLGEAIKMLLVDSKRGQHSGTTPVMP